MANWCVNDVRFSVAEAGIENVKSLFLKMQQDEQSSDLGQYPWFFDQEPEPCFFSIKTWMEGDDFMLSYLTKYIPNPGDMVGSVQSWR